MKYLYVIYTIGQDEPEEARFAIVPVRDETDEEYIIYESDLKIEGESFGESFSKKFLKKEFEYGFVTDRYNKKLLNNQLLRVKERLNSEHEQKKRWYETMIGNNNASYERFKKMIDNLKRR